MTTPWLTPQNAIQVAEECARSLSDYCSQGYRPGERIVDDPVIDMASARAGVAIWTAHMGHRETPFVAAICIESRYDGKETVFISKYLGAGNLSHPSIELSSWAAPLGGLFVKVKNARLAGKSFTEGNVLGRGMPIGPVADIGFNSSLKVDHMALLIDGLEPKLLPYVTGREVAPSARQATGYGLQAIVTQVDLEQDDRIREGIENSLIVTGPPGVGKTTIALQRIAFILYQRNQQEKEIHRNRLNPSSILVLVRKDHLVPYLERNLSEELGVFGVSVRTYDGIMRELLQRYCPHARFQLDRSAKEDLQQFLTTSVSRDSVNSVISIMSHSDQYLKCTPSEDVKGAVNRLLELSDALAQRVYHLVRVSTVAEEIAQLCREFRKDIEQVNVVITNCTSLSVTLDNLDHLVDDFRSSVRQLVKDRPHQEDDLDRLIQAFGSRLSQLRSRLLQLGRSAFDYYSILHLYYKELLAQEDQSHHELTTSMELEKQAGITTSDWLPLLYVIETITSGSSLTVGTCSPLPKFSHLVLDEAQFLSPDQINFFIGRIERVGGSFTIVGDLNQRIDRKTGLFRWDDVRIDGGQVQVRELKTVYRPTREIFDFSLVLGTVLEIFSQLTRPLRQNSGRVPQILKCLDEHIICENLAAYFTEDRRQNPKSSFCLIMPDPRKHPDFVKAFTEEMSIHGARVKVSYGEDIRESTEKVIVTDLESIVGLEFDSVVFYDSDGIANVVNVNTNRNMLWVALSRARKNLAVIYSASETIFDDKRFDKYRVDKLSGA